MRLDDIIRQIENVSKAEVKRVAPADCNDIKEIILNFAPGDPYEKMVVGFLTSICAEYMSPAPFRIESDNLDYIGFELERGTIEVAIAGSMLGSCMKGGRIVVQKAGDETGSSMRGGEIIADEVKSIGNTIGGKITAKKVGSISKNQGAEIMISGAKFRRGLLERLLGK